MKVWRWMFWLLVLPLQGASMAQVVSVAGGSTECALWTQARSASDAAVYEHYVLGCLNGLALGTGKEFWRTGSGAVSREAVYAWMDKYCAPDPLRLIAAGAIELFKERTKPSASNFQ